MRRWIVVLGVVFSFAGMRAQTLGWQPSAGHTQVAIWPGVAPDAQVAAGPEIVVTTGAKDFVAGRPWLSVEDVSVATMTVYSPPKGKKSGAAVVVFPGGGYEVLAMDLEGTEVCDWLTARGVTCVLLKYRVPGEKPYVGAAYPKAIYPKSGPYPESPIALDDAQRTMGLVRLHAKEWGIDPHKVGVLGFSGGGHLVAAISNHFEKRLYRKVDAADEESCRPDFGVAIYPGHLSLAGAEWDAQQGLKKFPLQVPAGVDKDLALNPDLHVTRETPPQFLLQAEDDHVDGVDSLAYYIALKNAGVPTELHLYARGGHAFGLRHTKDAITDWPGLVDVWMKSIGMVP
jgi:acetyl esterase/lipase